MKLSENEVCEVESFKYLRILQQKDGDSEKYIKQRINGLWIMDG